MHFASFEHFFILQNYISKRELCKLSTLNKHIQFTLRSSISPPGSSLLIACFYRWKNHTIEVLKSKKYKVKSSWHKKSKNEEAALLCF